MSIILSPVYSVQHVLLEHMVSNLISDLNTVASLSSSPCCVPRSNGHPVLTDVTFHSIWCCLRDYSDFYGSLHTS